MNTAGHVSMDRNIRFPAESLGMEPPVTAWLRALLPVPGFRGG